MSARWSFTYNGALPGQTIEVGNENGVAYMIYQHELAPETGRRHIQGYIRFANRKRFQTVQAWLAARGCGGAHIEAASGNEEQNRTYCSKIESRAPGGDPIEFGVYDADAGKQGKRSDLEAATGAIDRGLPWQRSRELTHQTSSATTAGSRRTRIRRALCRL